MGAAPRRGGAGRLVMHFLWAMVLAVGLWQAEPPTARPEHLVYDPERGEWVEEARPDPSTAEGALAAIRAEMAAGRFKEARKALEGWLKRYGERVDLAPEATYLLGRAEFELGDYDAAHERFLEVRSRWPGSAWTERALEGDFVVAEMYLSGKKRRLWGIPLLPATDEGLDILDDIIATRPRSALAERAMKTKADFYFRRGEFDLAELEYARLARSFPGSRYAGEAALRSAQAALAAFGGVEFDESPLIEAAERLRLVQQRYPSLAREENVEVILEDIRQKQAEKKYRVARFYQRRGAYDAAAFCYRRLMERYPDTVWARQAERRLRDMGRAPEEPVASAVGTAGER